MSDPVETRVQRLEKKVDAIQRWQVFLVIIAVASFGLNLWKAAQEVKRQKDEVKEMAREP